MSMDFDEILQHVGQFGLFQKYILVVIAIPIMITSWQSFLHAFVGFIPDHRCRIEGCDTDSTSYIETWLNNTVPGDLSSGEWIPDSCRMYSMPRNISIDYCMTAVQDHNSTKHCREWKYVTEDFDSTIATEWNLFCKKEGLVALTGTINMAGGLIGFVIMGYLSDRFGRKLGILLCLFFITGFGIAATWAPNMFVFMVMRFLIEAMESSLYQLLFVLGTEFVGPEKRVFGAQIIQLTYSCGEMTLAGLGYLFRSWRMLQFVTTVPSALFLSFYWTLPESARWLMANKKEEEANAIIRKVAKWNKGVLPQEMTSHYGTIHNKHSINEGSESSSETEILTDRKEPHVNALSLFRSPKLRMRTIIIMISWLLNVMAYNGVTLNATAIPGGSAQLNFFLTGLVEIPANLLSIYTMNRFGRRLTLSSSFILTGIPLIAIQFIPRDDKYIWAVVAMTLIGKFGSTVGNSVLYLFAAELLPTVLRNSGMGLCGLIGTIASMIAPQVTLFGQFEEALPYLIFGAGSLIGGCVSLCLPETLNQRLPETIEDAENFGK